MTLIRDPRWPKAHLCKTLIFSENKQVKRIIKVGSNTNTIFCHSFTCPPGGFISNLPSCAFRNWSKSKRLMKIQMMVHMKILRISWVLKQSWRTRIRSVVWFGNALLHDLSQVGVLHGGRHPLLIVDLFVDWRQNQKFSSALWSIPGTSDLHRHNLASNVQLDNSSIYVM